MSTGMIELIKRTAIDSIEATKPVDLKYGEVKTESPLTISITPMFVLGEESLVVPEHLTDYSVEIAPEEEIESPPKFYTFYNSLKVGDRVALIREKGGGKYFILDRF